MNNPKRSFTIDLPMYVYIGKKKVHKIPLSKNNFVGMNRYVYAKIKTTYTKSSIYPRLFQYTKMVSADNKIKQYKLCYQFILPNKRVKDPSNFWSKVSEFYLDALVQYGFIEDDNMKYDKGHFMNEPIYDSNITDGYIKVTLEEQ